MVQPSNALIFAKQRKSAKDCMTNTSKELVKETDRSLLHSKSDSDVNNNSSDTITQLIIEQDGDFTLHPDQHLRLRHHTGSSTTIGSRIKVGILDELRTSHFNTYSQCKHNT